MIDDRCHHRQFGSFGKRLENLLRPDVVRRRIQEYDEVIGEQIIDLIEQPLSARSRYRPRGLRRIVAILQNVGERTGRVSEITFPLKQRQDCPDVAVDLRCVFASLRTFIIERGVVGLIVKDQEDKIIQKYKNSTLVVFLLALGIY